MSDEGRQAKQALLSLRELHGQVVNLLRTCDHHAASQGMVGWYGDTATMDRTVSLSTHANWSPDFAFRVYRVAGRPALATFASVLLLPLDPDHLARFHEPLFSVGWVRYAEARTDKWFPHPEVARAAFWAEVPPGPFVPFRAPEVSMVAARVSARPLFGLTADGLAAAFAALHEDMRAALHDSPPVLPTADPPGEPPR